MFTTVARSLIVCSVAIAASSAAQAQILERPHAALLGDGSPGARGLPRLVYDGAPIVGKPFALGLESPNPSTLGIVALSSDPAATPLALFGAEVHVALPAAWVSTFVTDGAGGATIFDVSGPLASSAVGVRIVAQAALVDGSAPSGLALSPALVLRGGEVLDGPLFGVTQLSISSDPSTQVTRLFVDVDGDGRIDIFEYHVSSGVCRVQFCRPGYFEAPVEVAALPPSCSVRIHDVDGDDSLDIVASLPDTQGTLLVARRTTSGFAPSQVHYVFGAPSAFEFGDLDGDGIEDLVYSGFSPGQVLRALGLGGGTYGAPHVVALPTPFAVGRLLDIDGDGALDMQALATTSVAGTLVWETVLLFGRGDGEFDVGPKVPFPSNGLASRWGDIDADGDQDVVVVIRGNHGISSVALLRFDRATGFALEPGQTGFTYLGAHDLLDVDADGDLDIVVEESGALFPPYFEGHGLWCFENDGAGHFAPAVAYPSVQWQPFPTTDVEFIDFDGDGTLDFVSNHEVYFGAQGGTSNTARSWLDMSLGSPVVAPWEPILLGGDFDGDGRDDIAAVNDLFTAVALQGDDGSFDTPIEVKGLYRQARDVNGDGRTDLIETVQGSTSPWWNQARVAVRLSNGPSGFGAEQVTNLQGTEFSPEFGDFDGDGILDLVCATPSHNAIKMYPGLGDGRFAAPVTTLSSMTSILLEPTDLDGDGHHDLVGSRTGTGELHVAHGNGDGSFTNAIPLAGTGLLVTGDARDFNGDGAIDLAVARYSPNAIEILLQQSNGSFASSSIVSVTGIAGRVVADDFDRDGLVDLMFPSRLLARGDGSGGFDLAPQAKVTDWNTKNYAVIDANSDGLPDFVDTAGIWLMLRVTYNRSFVR
jgi:hypothetical protein